MPTRGTSAGRNSRRTNVGSRRTRQPREPWERQAIIDYFDKHPLEGYRRLTFMMLDEGIVAVSPATVYRVLKGAGRLDQHCPKPNTKGTGFVQPLGPHSAVVPLVHEVDDLLRGADGAVRGDVVADEASPCH